MKKIFILLLLCSNYLWALCQKHRWITLQKNLNVYRGNAQTLYNGVRKINTIFIPNIGYKLTEIRHYTDLQTIKYGVDLSGDINF